MPTPTIARNTHTPSLDSDSEMSLYHYLAAAALDIPTPTDNHAYLTYKLDVIKILVLNAAEPLYRKACGLRVKEIRLLRLIHDYPNITSSELKVKLVLDKTLLSKYLAGLEQRGMIEKIPDKQDNRIQQLRLTAAGEQAWQTCETIGRGLEAKFFHQMSGHEWDQLHRLLDKALNSLTDWHSQATSDD